LPRSPTSAAGLKRLAKELDCAVVALSQLSRAGRAARGQAPALRDLRESGSIEQDADTVCFLYREEYYLHGRSLNRQEKAKRLGGVGRRDAAPAATSSS
jgi:replicative DNA helicase